MPHDEPEQLADALENEADRLERRSDEVREGVEAVREDWDRKRQDDSVPGAPRPDSDEQSHLEADGEPAPKRSRAN